MAFGFLFLLSLYSAFAGRPISESLQREVQLIIKRVSPESLDRTSVGVAVETVYGEYFPTSEIIGGDHLQRPGGIIDLFKKSVIGTTSGRILSDDINFVYIREEIPQKVIGRFSPYQRPPQDGD